MSFSTYEECLIFLYQRNQFAIKLGLENIESLILQRGIDTSKTRYIHVAGTNGKGSVCHFISQYLRSLQYKNVGVYASPHLVSFRERIVIDGEVIPREWILQWMNSAQELLIKRGATYFECVTLMALEYFQDQKCEICILETGLGGRLDATNVVRPELTILTSISLDHESILGSTLPEIAREKLGILKPKVPLVLNEPDPSLCHEVMQVAKPLQVPVFNISELPGPSEVLPPCIRWDEGLRRYVYKDSYAEVIFKGNFKFRPHLLRNLELSLFAVHVWQSFHNAPSHEPKEIEFETLPGRIQCLESEGKAPVILDCAHNENSLKELRLTLQNLYPERKITLLFSIMKDKNLQAVFEQVNILADILLFESLPEFERALPYEELKNHLPLEAAPPTRAFVVEKDELHRLIDELNPHKDLLVVAGSFYLLGKVIPQLSEKYAGLSFFRQFLEGSSNLK